MWLRTNTGGDFERLALVVTAPWGCVILDKSFNSPGLFSYLQNEGTRDPLQGSLSPESPWLSRNGHLYGNKSTRECLSDLKEIFDQCIINKPMSFSK